MAEEQEQNHIDKISEIISELSTKSTFSADAMHQFLQLKDEADGLEFTNNYLRRNNKELEEQIKDVEVVLERTRDAVGDLTSELDHYRKREGELLDREAQMTRHEMTAMYEEKRCEDHKEMFKIVFRNAVIKRQVMTPLEAGTPNEYNSCPAGGFAQKDELEETEE